MHINNLSNAPLLSGWVSDQCRHQFSDEADHDADADDRKPAAKRHRGGPSTTQPSSQPLLADWEDIWGGATTLAPRSTPTPTPSLLQLAQINVVGYVDVSSTPWTDDERALMALLRPTLDEHVALESAMEPPSLSAHAGPRSQIHSMTTVASAPTASIPMVHNSVATVVNQSTLPIPQASAQIRPNIPASINFPSQQRGAEQARPQPDRKRPRSDCVDETTSATSANRRGTDNKGTPSSTEVRFHASQSGHWQDRFRELEQFRKQQGHCCIPNTWPPNPPLALWVKRQRYQMKLKREGKHSTMTPPREAALDSLGFVWDSHSASWEERFHELCAFQAEQGHCNVPANWPENKQLAVWVKCQRRQYVLRKGGKQSAVAEERVARLKSLGFVFCPRGQGK